MADVVGRSCRHSQRDVEEFVGLVWIALRQVEHVGRPEMRVCGRECRPTTAGLSIYLSIYTIGPRKAWAMFWGCAQRLTSAKVGHGPGAPACS